MLAIITGIMDAVFIGFAVYGIFVFLKWHRIADKIEAMLDEMNEEQKGGDRVGT